VTYFRSSTPKGGHHYWKAAEAGIRAQQDLRNRPTEKAVRTKIIGQSDSTGYVAVARATVMNENKGITAVGRGPSQKEADEDALKKLNRTAEEIANQTIVYQYFSYGSDSGSRHGKANHHHDGRANASRRFSLGRLPIS
jgi:hypothetical protein